MWRAKYCYLTSIRLCRALRRDMRRRELASIAEVGQKSTETYARAAEGAERTDSKSVGQLEP
jgi:hypothetical protein